MTKLFAFGCSFTNYQWPTWADILGRTFDHFENWGRQGAGNSFIFNSVIECHLRKTICKEDVVIVMWTNVSREDRYVNKEWIVPGNIYTQSTYDEEFVKKFADTRGYYIRDLAQMYATQQLLKNIGCKYFFLSMMPLENPMQYEIADANDSIKDILPYYKSVVDEIRPSVYEVVFNHDWWSRPFLPQPSDKIENNYNENAGTNWPTWQQFLNKDFKDVSEDILQVILDKNRWDWEKLYKRKKRVNTHPTPSEHLEYIQKVLPEFVIDQSTVKWAQEIDHLLRQEEGHNHQKQVSSLIQKQCARNIQRW